MSSPWYLRGVSAQHSLSAARYGDRQAGLVKLSSVHGVSAQTLRREVAAARFLRLEFEASDDLIERLQLAPMASIEHLARWWRIDRNRALAASRRIADGALSVRELEKEMRSASARGDASHRPHDEVFRENVSKSLAAMGGKVETYVSGGFGVPFDFRWWISSRWPVMVIVAGPYGDRDRYDARRVDWCLRADWHNRWSEALLILADPEMVLSYEAFREANRLGFVVVASKTGHLSLAPGKAFERLSRGDWQSAIVPCDQ